MGLSLVGNSGDQTTTSNVYETTNTASINPQVDQEGSGPGAVALQISPNVQDGSIGELNTNLSSYFAPINVVSTGDLLGDTALSALSSIASNQESDTQGPGVAAPASTLSSLLSGNTLYWILGAIVILFLAHKK
jgi:hypothetical protein